MRRSRSRPGPSAPESARPPGELEEGGVEGVGPEVRPEDLGRVELGVGRLPDQEVREPLLAAGPDHEVGIGQAGGVERLGDRVLVDLVGCDAPLGQEPRNASTSSVRPA